MSEGAFERKRKRRAGIYDVFPPPLTTSPPSTRFYPLVERLTSSSPRISLNTSPSPGRKTHMSLGWIHGLGFQNEDEYILSGRAADAEIDRRISQKGLSSSPPAEPLSTPDGSSSDIHGPDTSTVPDDNSSDIYHARGTTIGGGSSVGQQNPYGDDGERRAGKRAKREDRRRAETKAARTAQARRDATIKIQRDMEAVIPLKWLQGNEEEKKGLDPRARAMVAAIGYIKHLAEENEQLKDAYHSTVPTKQQLPEIGHVHRSLPQFPDHQANHHQIRTLRAVATNLVRVVQGRERSKEGVLDEDLADRLGEITDRMLEVIEVAVDHKSVGPLPHEPLDS